MSAGIEKRSPTFERLRRLAAAAVLVVICWAWAAAAVAAPAADAKSAAKKKLVEGGELLKRGDFQAALARFEEAHALVPSPKIQYDFGLAYMGLGRNAAAVEAFESFLAQATDASAESLGNARRYRRELIEKITRVTVLADVDGAVIYVDGHSYGVTPRTEDILLDPGPHLLLVEKEGTDKPFTQRFDAAAGQSITLSATLHAPSPAADKSRPRKLHAGATATAEAPPAPAHVDSAPSGIVAASPAVPAPTPATGEPPPWMTPTAWTAAGLAAVGLGLGGIEWAIKEQKYGKFNSEGCDIAKPALGGGDCSSLLHDGDSAKRVAIIGFVSGGALAAASAGLFIWRATETSHAASGSAIRDRGVALACAPALTGLGAACALRF
jgi:hypothetical protein